MLNIICVTTGFSLSMLLLGFSGVHFPFILKNTRSKFYNKFNMQAARTVIKRKQLYNQTHIGFINICKPTLNFK